jgi:predicted DNA-binding transcriptional regulator YafY
MDLVDRVYRLHRILRASRYPVSGAVLRERLECSRATFNRILQRMRDSLGAPIEYDRVTNGYCYTQAGEHPYELPGLWFNASELHALLTCQQLLSNTQPGLFDEHLAPLRERIEGLLTSKHSRRPELSRRIRILSMAARRIPGDHFVTVAGALLDRRQMSIRYHGRGRDEISERILSPQRLAHYRDNWYLDAWDHGKRALRTFAVERIREPHALETRAKDIPEQRLDRHFTESYGIFAGKPKHKALLRFTPERARWVADERWHPRQNGWMENGHYFLQIPYSDERELILDILKYGPDVEVLAPATLRRAVAGKLRAAANRYDRAGIHA